jgi:hypothetical protein
LNLNDAQLFPDNEIRTSVYSIYDFLPRFLFYQFQRLANGEQWSPPAVPLWRTPACKDLGWWLCNAIPQTSPRLQPSGALYDVPPAACISARL